MENMSYVGFHRSYKNMLHNLFAARHCKWLFNLLTWGGRIDFPIHLNMYDIMCVVAKKPLV